MKRIIAIVMVAVMLIFSLAGCGSKPSNVQNTSAEGGSRELNLRSVSQIQTLDPSQTRVEQNVVILEQVYEGLYMLSEKEGKYVLGLAKTEQISDDGLVYTFTLQDGVKFHNGDDLKASDVVFSFKHYMSNTLFNAYTNMIVSVEAPDDKTVVVTLNKPYSPIAHTFHTVKIMSQKVAEEQGKAFGTKVALAGTGPYMVESYDASVKLTLKAFPQYWKGEASIKTVNYIPILDDASALIALENGEIDWMNVPLADWESVKANDKFSTEIIPGNWTQYLGINYQRNEVLGNDLVRQAIAYALDKEAMNLATFEGYGKPTDYYMPVEYVTATPTEFTKYPYDPEKSKKLLAEAGYSNGVEVGEILAYGAAGEKTAQVMQANLANVGIKASVSVLEIGIALDRMNSQDFDLCLANDMGNFDFNNYRQQVDSRSKGMYMVKFEGDKFDYKHFDELFDKGTVLTDTNERKAVYTELYDDVMKTATLLPLLHSPVANAWVKGLNVINVPTNYHIYDWSFDNN